MAPRTFPFPPGLPHLASSSGGLQEENPPGCLEKSDRSHGLFLSSFAPAQGTQLGKGTAGLWVPDPQQLEEVVGRGDTAAWRGARTDQPVEPRGGGDSCLICPNARGVADLAPSSIGRQRVSASHHSVCAPRAGVRVGLQPAMMYPWEFLEYRLSPANHSAGKVVSVGGPSNDC